MSDFHKSINPRSGAQRSEFEEEAMPVGASRHITCGPRSVFRLTLMLHNGPAVKHEAGRAVKGSLRVPRFYPLRSYCRTLTSARNGMVGGEDAVARGSIF